MVLKIDLSKTSSDQLIKWSNEIHDEIESRRSDENLEKIIEEYKDLTTEHWVNLFLSFVELKALPNDVLGCFPDCFYDGIHEEIMRRLEIYYSPEELKKYKMHKMTGIDHSATCLPYDNNVPKVDKTYEYNEDTNEFECID